MQSVALDSKCWIVKAQPLTGLSSHLKALPVLITNTRLSKSIYLTLYLVATPVTSSLISSLVRQSVFTIPLAQVLLNFQSV